jgi:uncharacterized protein
MMDYLTNLEALHALYGTPAEAATIKVTSQLIATYATFIEHSRFAILSTVGPDGTDASPRGDDGPVVQILDAQTLALPDWRGNDRIDSLRNIVRDGRVSLMFMIPGVNNVLRINGTARLTADPAMLARFARDGHLPRTVAIITIAEVYSQCARALIRSGLWHSGDQSKGIPTVGDMLRDVTSGTYDGAGYDAAWPTRAARTMW